MITFEFAPDIVFTPENSDLASEIYRLRFGNVFGQSKKDKLKEEQLLMQLNELNKKMETNNKNEKSGLIHPIDFIDKMVDGFDRIAKDINKDFDKGFKKVFGEDFQGLSHQPSANIYKTENGVSLEMTVPGYDKNDIDISLEKNTLIVSGKKEENKQDFTMREFSYSSFSRSFNLSERLNRDTIKSSLNNGILTVNIAKLQPETVSFEKKKIPVE